MLHQTSLNANYFRVISASSFTGIFRESQKKEFFYLPHHFGLFTSNERAVVADGQTRFRQMLPKQIPLSS